MLYNKSLVCQPPVSLLSEGQNSTVSSDLLPGKISDTNTGSRSGEIAIGPFPVFSFVFWAGATLLYDLWGLPYENLGAVNYKINIVIVWLETIWKIFFRGFTISFQTKLPKTIPYLPVYNAHFFPTEKAPKIEMRIIHGTLCFRLASLISM